ncbi:MAG: aminoglycoside phosphotransferase family protein [Chthoniobacteraceae bacterium]|nr:aminoglycoside phosphotransferase family protein [Chthoniobacteraceae bacterium]
MRTKVDKDRRHPRRPFDPSLIADYLGERRVLSAVPLLLGKSQTNYKLTLSDGEIFVLRLHHRSAHPERDRAALELARGLVPVPSILAWGKSWSIHSYIEGTVLAEAPECTRAAAEALARLSTLRFPSAGWIEPDGSITPFDFGNGRSFLDAILERRGVLEWIGPETVQALREIDAKQPAAQSDEPPCLVHGDFNPTNILVRNGAVTGVLDWEFAHAGDRYMDLGNLLRHTDPALHGEIEAGFAAEGYPLPGDWKERAERVDLGAHLEFLTSGRADPFKAQCVEWIGRFVERYR